MEDAIQVQCPHCQARFAGSSALLGKRVRCKHCTNIFEVKRFDPQEQPEFDLEPESYGEHDETRSGANLSSAGAQDDFDDLFNQGDDTPEQPFQPAPIAAVSGTPVIGFLDGWLAHLMLGVSAIWFILLMLRVDDANRPWLPWVRLMAFAALYLILVFPLTLWGVKSAINKQRGHLPWSHKYKTAAIFSLPFVLAFALGKTAESMPMFMIGALIGLAPALVAWWLLFRVRAEASAFITPGASFIFGMLLILGLAVGVNYTVFAAATSSNTTHEYTVSPVFPGLPWEAAESRPAADPDKKSDWDKVVTAQTPAQVPTEHTPASQPAVPETASTPELAPVPLEPVATTAVDSPMDGTDAASPEPVAVDVDVPAAPTAAPDAAVEVAADGLVGEIITTPIAGGFDRVVAPGVASPWRLIVRADKGEDQIFSRWNSDAGDSDANVRLRRDGQLGDADAISPDGELMVRLASWPQLSAQVWSFPQKKVVKSFPLDKANGKPGVIGFLDERRVLLSWSQGNGRGLELLNIDRNPNAKSMAFVLPGVDDLGRNFVLNGDRAYTTGMHEGQVYLQIFDVGRSRLERRVPIPQIDPSWNASPAALVLSSDQSKLAAMFEHKGNVMILQWNLSVGATPQPIGVPAHFPAGVLSSLPKKFDGPLMLWLPEGWLVWGQDLVDPQDGNVIGSLGIPDVMSQRLLPDGQLELVVIDKNGKTQLVRAKLKS